MTETKRRPFTITKFERSPDGYLHAHVTPAGGKHIYVHRRFGAWMAPGTIRDRAVLKEVTREVAVELQKKAHTLEKAEKGGNGEDKPDGADADAATGGEADV